jgi:hypothetical protein
MNKALLLIIAISLTCGGISCGGSTIDEGEDYGNLLETEEGLVLTEGEHLGGWGRAECTICHNLENIHLVNRTGVDLDIGTIYNQVISEGLSSCATCHGTNGVP